MQNFSLDPFGFALSWLWNMWESSLSTLDFLNEFFWHITSPFQDCLWEFTWAHFFGGGAGSVGRRLHTVFIPTDFSMQGSTDSSPPLHCSSPFQATSHGHKHRWWVGKNDLEKKTYRTYQQIPSACMITIFEERKKRHKIYSLSVRKKSLYTVLKVNLKRYIMKK